MGGLVCGLMAAIVLVFSEHAMDAACASAEVFVRGVMPALFPMMVLGQLFPMPRVGERLGAQRWGMFASTVAFSFAAGTPASFQRVALLQKAGCAKGSALPVLVAATGVMSPMFFVGTLAMLTGKPGACRGMLLLHWLGALVTAGLVAAASALHRAGKRGHGGARIGCMTQPNATTTAPNVTIAPTRITLTAAVGASAQAMLSVLGAMMVFSIVAAVLRALLAALWPQWVAANGHALSVLWALLEIGGGASALTKQGTPSAALLCGLCSFGGLSIALQGLTFVGAYIRPVKLLCLRALHGAVSYVLCRLAQGLFPAAFAAFAAAPDVGGGALRMPVLLPLLLIVLAVYPTLRRELS